MKNNKKINNILEEILRQNPNLKKDKKHLEKVVEFLSKNNPEYKGSKEFKSKLKKRLDSIIKIKKGNLKPRYNYFQIFSGVFTTIFVFFGFFYLMQENLFIFNKNKQDTLIKETLIIENSKEFLEENQQKTKNENSLKKEVKINKAKIEKTNKIQNIFKSGIKIKENKVDNKETIKKQKLEVEAFDMDKSENKTNNNKQKIFSENNGKTIKKEDLITDNKPLKRNDNENIKKNIPAGLQPDIMQLKPTGFKEEGINGNINDEFKQFCINIGGIFMINKKSDICRYNKKECNREEYSLGKCLNVLKLDSDIDINLEELINEFSENNLLDEK